MTQRTWIRGTMTELDKSAQSDDWVCDICDENTATHEAISFQQTQVDPAEYVSLCDKCAGIER